MQIVQDFYYNATGTPLRPGGTAKLDQ